MTVHDRRDLSITLLPSPHLSIIWKTNHLPFAFVLPDLPEDQREEFANALAEVYLKVLVRQEAKV